MPRSLAADDFDFDRVALGPFWADFAGNNRKRLMERRAIGVRGQLPTSPLAALGLDITPWSALAIGLTTDALTATGQAAKVLWPSKKRAASASSRPIGGIPKRVLDSLVASLALVVLSPLMLLVALLIRTLEGGPIFISHPRIGYGGRTFRCYKFRTMVVDGDKVLERHLAENPQARRMWAEMRKLAVDPRVTPIGRLLRKSSLDELPQLWNVLRGEMSCVGPRPIVADELPKYGAQARHYLRTWPGLTGIWQVSGRSSTTYRQRVAMDTLYARRWSFWLDVWVLLMTIPAVLKTDDAV